MATKIIHDLYADKTLYMIAGSTEYFRLTLRKETNSEVVDLSSVQNVEWFFTTFSVNENKAIIYKSLTDGNIILLQDYAGNYTGTIQVTLESIDTMNLQGAFVHQIVITDGGGKRFTPFQGLIVIDRGIVR